MKIFKVFEAIGFAAGLAAATTGVLTTKLEAKDPRATLLFLDFESTHESDEWIRVLGLTEKHCPKDVHLCNSDFIAYRPLADPAIRRDWLAWLEARNILPDAVFISGHHSGGFWGILGSFYLSDVRPLLARPYVHSLLTNPTFVYLGGCYTVDSRFLELEGSPSEYLRRVLSHQERPSPELLTAAIHQIGIQGIENPWAPIFPNAALFGYGGMAPGEKSTVNSTRLIEGFGRQVSERSGITNKSTAFKSLLKSADGKRASSRQFEIISEWWNREGQQDSRTSASALCRADGNHCEKVEFDLPVQDQETSLVLAEFASELLRPSDGNSWAKSLPVAERAGLLRHTHSALARTRLDYGESLHLRLACASTFSDSVSPRIREEAVRLIEVLAGVSNSGTLSIVEKYALADASASVRSVAAVVLYARGQWNEEIRSGMVEGLQHRESDIRLAALGALAKDGISDQVEVQIVDRISDTDRNVGLEAASIIFDRRDQLSTSAHQRLQELAKVGNEWAQAIEKGEDPRPKYSGGGSPIMLHVKD